ncbi:MAG: trypsin-like peptidase domain-containing protein [Anaerolineae bacterium]|nr:trypsin-like peptidase domain-containing protein [Phycisphaerae bacterium]
MLKRWMILAAALLAPALSRAEAPESVNLRRTVTVDVVERCKAAVVYISTTKLVAERFSLFGGDPVFERFGPSDVRVVPRGSLGSGFIIHANGYIVTNHHVIDGAREITVELIDGRKLPAELVSSDPDNDLAILKVATTEALPALSLGDSSDLLIGEPVIAVGNPLGYSHSVSTGIVSALHRELKPSQEVTLADVLQTDAAINPGNSGGPLLNAYGQVIGINTAIRGDAQNIGFAIQVNRLRDLMPELLNPATVDKVEIGAKFAEKRTIRPPATVETVVSMNDKPVASINGKPVVTIVDASVALLGLKENDHVKIKFADGSEQELTAAAVPLPDALTKARERLGVTIEPLTPMKAERFGLLADAGMLVTEVLHDTPAERVGLQPGDVIVQLGRYPIRTLKDFSAIMKMIPDRAQFRVGVIRGGQVAYGTMRL